MNIFEKLMIYKRVENQTIFCRWNPLFWIAWVIQILICPIQCLLSDSDLISVLKANFIIARTGRF